MVCKVIDGLNVGGSAWLLSFGIGVENIQNQNNGIGEMDIVGLKAILNGGNIFICPAKDIGVKEVGISVYFLS